MSVVLICLSGCIKSVDPETGQTTYRLDLDRTAEVEKHVETGISIFSVLSTIWPSLLPIAGIGAGIYGTWKKMKPKFEAEQNRAQMYYSIVDSGVKTIEDFKMAQPEKWDELEKKYWTGVIGPEAENVIRALRGLPLIEIV